MSFLPKAFFLTVVGSLVCSVAMATNIDETVTWLNEQGLTKFKTEKDFKPNDPLTREQAAKFYSELADKVFDKELDTKTNCGFSDLAKADKSLRDYLKKSCQYGLFKGNKGKFDPRAKLTNAQAIVVLMRLMEGVQDETGNPWYKDYYELANDAGILDELAMGDSKNAEKPAKRGEVGMMMYNANQTVTQSNTNTTNVSVNGNNNTTSVTNANTNTANSNNTTNNNNQTTTNATTNNTTTNNIDNSVKTTTNIVTCNSKADCYG